MASGNLRDRHAASKTSDLTQTLVRTVFCYLFEFDLEVKVNWYIKISLCLAGI